MSFCSAISISHGSVISTIIDRKCLWDGSHLNKNATVGLYFTIELNLSYFPKGRFFSVKTSTTKFEEFSRQMSISHDGPLSLILSITLVSGLNGDSGTINHMKISVTLKVRPFKISPFKRFARRSA